MKKMFNGVVLLLLSAVLFSATAKIHEEVKIINKYGQVGLWNTHSAQTLGFGRLAFNVYGNHTGNEDFIWDLYRVDENGVFNPLDVNKDERVSPEFTKTTLNVALSYGFTRFLDLGVSIPIHIDWVDAGQFEDGEFWPDSDFNSAIGVAGDAQVSAKFQYPPYPHRDFFKMAYYGSVTIPTGNTKEGRFPRNNYYEDKRSGNIYDYSHFYTTGKGKVDVDMKMLWTWDFREVADNFPVLFHANYGLKWTTNTNSQHVFSLNTGLEVRPADFLAIFVDFSAEPRFGSVEQEEYTRPTDGVQLKRGMLHDPMRISPGVAFLIPGGFNITAGTDISLSDANGRFVEVSGSDDEKGTSSRIVMETAVEPKVALAASIGWNGFVLPQDADQDGIKDNVDNCPQEAEDFDGFNDGDGCPEFDNDNDGVADSVDNCMNEAEDKDGFEDEDGCPDLDNDGDGVVDLNDGCPLVAEDMDGFNDADGCPDYDNDVDGVADSVDNCPDIAEDLDGFEDTDGCIDVDNDQDGILDTDDKCVNEAETFDTFEDADGCPDVKPVEVVEVVAAAITRDPIVLRGVSFHSGSANLTADSYDILDGVLASLLEWPEVKVEISGHTDSVGGESGNRRLSHNRAKSVMEYFEMQGVASTRMRAIGKGESTPVASNATADGRALNRRVEMRKID